MVKKAYIAQKFRCKSKNNFIIIFIYRLNDLEDFINPDKASLSFPRILKILQRNPAELLHQGTSKQCSSLRAKERQRRAPKAKEKLSIAQPEKV